MRPLSDGSLRDFVDNAANCRPSARAPDRRAGRFHRSMPGYAPTPVADAPGAAAQLGLRRLVVKLETARLGLPSFKVLGASWAACRALSRHAGRDEPVPTFDALRELAATSGGLALVAATDGNHGRAVAHMARLLDLEATILVPAHTARARIDAIAGEGAVVEIVRGSYDDAIMASAALADDAHLVISDTSWPGYEDVAGWVADGYRTIFDELDEQLDEIPPLVAIQIGVGALASAAVRALAVPGRVLVGVEPADAACALQAVRAGAPVLVDGPHRSIMAGLNCGTASLVALPDIEAGIAAFCAIDDRAAERAVRLLLDEGLACGETGAAGVAGLLAIRERWPQRTWERVGAAGGGRRRSSSARRPRPIPPPSPASRPESPGNRPRETKGGDFDMATEQQSPPPMDPDSSEADSSQLDLAREQGAAYRKALDYMAQEVADDGGTQPAGEYLIGYAVEEAEGMYMWEDGELVWQDPEDENLHVEIAVCDASDGRFVPGCTVTGTLIDPDGNEVGTHVHPLLWHPMLYHYGRNWKVPADGTYTLKVRVDPPTFMRHDEINGCRFKEPVETIFKGVEVERGQD